MNGHAGYAGYAGYQSGPYVILSRIVAVGRNDANNHTNASNCHFLTWGGNILRIPRIPRRMTS